ncbi:hypothetical protein, partial [Nostoc sp.]|uniref:hypothetical protein n=1 Tax=Nostoc sp. TaxID=1180 RepID=UPI003B6056A0
QSLKSQPQSLKSQPQSLKSQPQSLKSQPQSLKSQPQSLNLSFLHSPLIPCILIFFPRSHALHGNAFIEPLAECLTGSSSP